MREREKLSVIGRTGSGKTSLVMCLTGLIEAESGTMLYYGRRLSMEQARANFSVIAQDPFVFEGSIQDNIDPNAYFTGADLRRVVMDYSVDEIPIMKRLGDRVDELGKNLSLGERQLVVLLRTLLQERRMVILDECSSNLDQEYSQIIMAMLDRYLKVKFIYNQIIGQDCHQHNTQD